ncbi:MAG TPA: sodium/solute symporter [Phycisphaerae bacterium]|nr:sodium/solute symporter [Phycisphaerae bacterium]HPU27653.1 sodium/solute symporter [Phycisphaerae bacterium]
MKGMESFQISAWDIAAFLGYFALLSLIGFWAGRRRKAQSDDYFLAGRSLPWYVVGCSFIASNISSEHFIGMIGAAFIFGISVAMFEWGNVLTFSILIWFFIPFLLSSRVFTTPEFMEKRFNLALRQFFAVVTVIVNVVAFLAAVLYGGGLALEKLFGWDLWLAIAFVGIASGVWAIYGGLSSVAWMDVLTVIIMVVGGLLVTILGLSALAGDSGSVVDGVRIMVERNQAQSGVYAEVVRQNAPHIAHTDTYNRLSVIQPATHAIVPWTGLIFVVFTVSIWYNVINQFMIQRVLGAKDMYHARMGIVLAGFLKVILPVIVVVPGLILFAMHPEIMKLPWAEIKPEADKGYVHMLQTVIPMGLRGLFLAALFGAIQSTVQAVLNSTATVFTMDVYQRLLRPSATERHLVAVGRITTLVVLMVAITLARLIPLLGTSLFEYIQNLYAFFAPPFGAVFLLGILFRRVNAVGATAAVVLGFLFSIGLKLYVALVPSHALWLEPFMTQAMVVWLFSVAVCTAVSLATPPPHPAQVTSDLTIDWRRLNIFSQLGSPWYKSVVLWWGLFVATIAGLMLLFSGIWL